MLQKAVKAFIGIVGGLFGLGFISILSHFDIMDLSQKGWLGIGVNIFIILLFAIIFYILSPKIMNKFKKMMEFIENEMQKIPVSDIILGTVGLITGLVIAFLVSQPISNLGGPLVGSVIQTLIFAVCGYLGVKIATRKRADVDSVLYKARLKWKSMDKIESEKEDKEDASKEIKGSIPKILDTSVIIDGRIADICSTGFLEGPLVIPEFVLNELQHIADSSDDLKRKRGRRGLDILNKMQKELDIEIIISDKKYKDIKEVDSKLLRLTQDLNGRILTNDYNLNKVANVQNIEVLNINELANAVKPVVLPGEEMLVEVVRDGKESGQGLGYLDDGTMIVVESGKKYIGKEIDVVVTSVLQTSAGKMIFGRPKALKH